jgi:hypothetical protein
MRHVEIGLYAHLGDKLSPELTLLNNGVFESIMSSLRKETPSRTAQSHVIIGSAGSGKTTLLNRLLAELAHDASYEPVILNAQALFSFDDIWRHCPGSTFDATLAQQEQNGKRIVLLVDNIHYLFRRTDQAAQYALRGKLTRAGAPILIGTASEVLSEFVDYKAAFFEGLRLSYILPAGDDAIAAMHFNTRELPRVNALRPYLSPTIRSLLMIRRVLRQSPSSATDLDLICEYFAPAYQASFNTLALQCQRILTTLAATPSGMVLQELRTITHQESGSISPYLKRLADLGIIERIASTQRNATYRIADPLFRYWLSSRL